MKLTKPQTLFLKKLLVTGVVPKGPEWNIARNLAHLGLVSFNGKPPFFREITEAGKAALAKQERLP